MDNFSHLTMNTISSIPPRHRSLLSALAIFQHCHNNEAIKSVHVYICTNEVSREEIIERDFTFSGEAYFELGNNFLVRQLVTSMPRFYAGLVIDEWVCILAFDSRAPLSPSSFPPILDPSINPKLASVPSLLHDLKFFFELMRLAQVPLNPISNAGQDDRSCQPDISANNPPFLASTNLDDPPSLADEKLHDPQPFSGNDDNTIDDRDDILLLNSEDIAIILANLDLDNPLLLSIAAGQIPAFNISAGEHFEVDKHDFQGLKAPSVANINSEKEDRFAEGPKAPDVEDNDSMRKHPVIEGMQPQKQPRWKRASSSRVQSITLSDIEKHYDLPLAKAAEKLGIGRSILKKKCREFGFSRWPYRKINSINKLITAVEGQVNQQEQENISEAVQEAEELQKMLQLEKEAIQKRPDMKVQEETILQFRRDFHRRSFDERRIRQ